MKRFRSRGDRRQQIGLGLRLPMSRRGFLGAALTSGAALAWMHVSWPWKTALAATGPFTGWSQQALLANASFGTAPDPVLDLQPIIDALRAQNVNVVEVDTVLSPRSSSNPTLRFPAVSFLRCFCCLDIGDASTEAGGGTQNEKNAPGDCRELGLGVWRLGPRHH
jgi:hypothetical protein